MTRLEAVTARVRAAGVRAAMLGAVRAKAVTGDPVARILTFRADRSPYPLYEAVRARGRISRSSIGFYVSASHAVVNGVLRDPRFGSSPVDRSGLINPIEHSLIMLNVPDHTHLRRVPAPRFSGKALDQYRERISDVVESCLDDLAARESFDLVRDFAQAVTVRVIAEVIGLPVADHRRFIEWGAVLPVALDPLRSARDQRRLNATMVEMEEYFTQLLDRRRRDPRDDVVTRLVQAETGEFPFSSRELLATVPLLLIAGFETTVSLIANASARLTAEPEHRAAFLERPENAQRYIDEFLRYEPPVQHAIRQAHEPVELDGLQVPRGSFMLLLLAGANRDPEVFADPQRFDPDRANNREHLAFSSGPHYCIGANLARIEAAMALTSLLRRFPDLRQTGPAAQLGTRTLRVIHSMPVQTRPGRATSGTVLR